MLEVLILIALGFVWIIFATFQDLKSREVANWLNFSLIVFALGIRFFYSLFNAGDFAFFYQGLIGLGIFFLLGNFFYYARFFAGGDAKLMIALGTILPLNYGLFSNLNLFIWFLFIFLFSGAVYGIFASGYLALKNISRFKLEFKKQILKKKGLMQGVMIAGLLLMVIGFFDSLFFYLGMLVFLFPLLFLYAKVVDEACMVKKVSSSKLTEGDWLYEKIKVGNQTINPKWEGLSKKQISQIKSYKKFVLIKQGIPFVPVFLISYSIIIALFYFGIPKLF